MPEPRLKMGLVGDRVPPSGFVKDLQAFDPDLNVKWSRPEQCWVITQEVRRVRYVGEMDGVHLSETRTEEQPVLFALDCQREPDNRLLGQLFSQRVRDRQERFARARRTALKNKRAKDEQSYNKTEAAREGMAEGYSALRRQGFAGSVAPVAVPGNYGG